MTKEEILAMEPGGELDRLVHEDVMENTRPWAYGRVRYSREISAAWLVAEEMLPEGFSFFLQRQRMANARPTWECCFYKYPPASPIRSILTAPEAICKAALLAKLEAEK